MEPSTLHDFKVIKCIKDDMENVKGTIELTDIVDSRDTQKIVDSINCANEMLVNIIKRLNMLEDHVYRNLK